MVAESACIPIPSETTFLFAGFNVARGEYSLLAVVATGTAANVVGSWIAYAVGYYGRVDILEKHGRKLHIKPSHLRWADDWFAKYGSATVFFTRMLPIVRTFISLPAGVARMPFWRFTVLTTLGCVPWILMLTLIGREVGDNWEQWKDSLHYVDYAVAAALVLGALWLYLRRRRGAAARARRPGSRPPMRRADAEALALGLLQGPAELVPVSSSGHVAALPWLLRWEVAGWDGARRKELEVALHAGAGAALLILLRPKRVRPRAAGRRGAAAGGRRTRARAADRGAARHAGDAGRRAARRRGARWCWPTARRRRVDDRDAGFARRPRARLRPDRGADAGRLAQRRHARRSARARLRPRGRLAPVLGGRAARSWPARAR